MEDIVAVRVDLEDGAHRFFLTWGRIQDIVDPEPLERLIFDHCKSFDLGGIPKKACVCYTLQEAVSAPYFYECFFTMVQQRIPSGKKYTKWLKQMDKKMRVGQELYYLGNPNRSHGRSDG
jgi:hypothetical protein